MAKKKKASAKAQEGIGESQPDIVVEGGEPIVIDGPSSGVTPVNNGTVGMSQLSPQLELNEPKVSPYSINSVTFTTGPGNTVFYIPKHHLQSTCWSNAEPGGSVEILGVSPETGHTLAHYLHTGTYDVLSGKSDFDHAFRVFNIATRYSLLGLENLSTDQMRSLGGSMTLCEILKKVRSDFSKLTGTSWIHRYLEERTRCQFEVDRTIFNQDAFAQSIGHKNLSRYMLRLVVRLFTEAHTRTLEAERKQEIEGEEIKAKIEEGVGTSLQNSSSCFEEEAVCAVSPAVEMSFEFPSAASGVDDVISLSSHDSGLLDGPPEEATCNESSEEIVEEQRWPMQAAEVTEGVLEPALPTEPTQATEEIVSVPLSKKDKKKKLKKRLAMETEAQSGESMAIPQTMESERKISPVPEPVPEEPTEPMSHEFPPEQSPDCPAANPILSEHEDVEGIPEPKSGPVMNPFAGLNKIQRKKLQKKMKDEETLRKQKQIERELEESALAEALAEEARIQEAQEAFEEMKRVTAAEAEVEAARLAQEEAERIQKEERDRLEEEEAAAATAAAAEEEAERIRSEEELNAEEEAQFFQKVASQPSAKGKARMLFERAIELDPLPPPPPPLDPEPLPEPAQATEPGAVVDDPWGFSAFGKKGKKKKNMKKDIVPEVEQIPESDAIREPQPSTYGDSWGFTFKPKPSFPGDLSRPVPEPPGLRPIEYDPWTFSFRTSAKTNSVAVENLPPPPPPPGPDVVQEAENDPWGFGTTSKKKKKKKGAIEEEPVPAPEQEAIPVAEDDPWGFGTTSKKKKKKKGSVEEPPPPDPLPEPLPETVTEETPAVTSTDSPAPAPPIVDDGWGSFWGASKKMKKKKKAAKPVESEVEEPPPPPPPPPPAPADTDEILEPELEAVAEPEPGYAMEALTDAPCYEVAAVDMPAYPDYAEPEPVMDAEPAYEIEYPPEPVPEPEVADPEPVQEPEPVDDVVTAALPDPEPIPEAEGEYVDEAETSTYCSRRKIHMSTSKWRKCDKCSSVLKDMAKQWIRENERLM